MPFYVYILQSEIDNSFYKGFSEDVFKRLIQHNEGHATYTKNKRPWKLVYFEELPDKKTALIREKSIKKADINRINALINCNKNLLNI
jgi:putative endonuclease